MGLSIKQKEYRDWYIEEHNDTTLARLRDMFPQLNLNALAELDTQYQRVKFYKQQRRIRKTRRLYGI